jgi:hypothetical protein
VRANATSGRTAYAVKMFIGHYGYGFAAKRLDLAGPLWMLFLAVQLLDVFRAVFVLPGIVRVRIVPGFVNTQTGELRGSQGTAGLRRLEETGTAIRNDLRYELHREQELIRSYDLRRPWWTTSSVRLLK